MASLLPTPEPPDPIEGALGHFEHTNWVKAALKALDVGTVHSVGGSAGGLTVDQLTINPAASQNSTLVLQGDGTRVINGTRENGNRRWQLFLGDTTAETGNNSGSLFGLLAYGDDSSPRATVLEANRDTGLVKVAGNPTAALGVATKQYVDAAVPIGTIIMYGGSTIPAAYQATWHLCDGSPHGSSALQTAIGSANAPDLRGLFVVGAGKNADTALAPTTYAVGTGAKLGKEDVTLTQAQTPLKSHDHNMDHNHPAGATGAGSSHNHSIDHDHPAGNTNTKGAHTHGGYQTNWLGSGMDQNPAGDDYRPTGMSGGTAGPNLGTMNTTGDHFHSFDAVNFAGTSGPEGGHTHSAWVSAFTGYTGPAGDGTATAHENRPPYYALTYIIKKA